MDAFGGIDMHLFCDEGAVRRALMSEIAADDIYGDVVSKSKNPRVIEVFKEIRADEQNHQGRLLSLLIELEGVGGPFCKNFNNGLEGKESKDNSSAS